MSKQFAIAVTVLKKSLFSYYTILIILALPVVSDVDFIVIAGNILSSVNDTQIVKPGILLYQGSRKDGRGNEPLPLRNVRCTETPEDFQKKTWPVSDRSVACYSLTSFALLVHG